MDETLFRAVVEEAVLAPTAHNTQPARWVLDGDMMHLGGAAEAALPVADPEMHDTLFGCGTVLEGMIIALSRHGIAGDVIYGAGHVGEGVLASIRMTDGAAKDPLADAVEKRFTCRTGFAPPSTERTRTLKNWAAAQQDVHLFTDRAQMAQLSDENDRLSLNFFNNAGFRRELMEWSRMSPRHPRWNKDGLNAEALGISRLEAMAMPWVMRGPVLGVLRAVGLLGKVVSERDKTLQATGICFVTAPAELSDIEAGRRFYRLALELAQMGFATWPMSVIKDDPEAHAAWLHRLGLGSDMRLTMCLRVGLPAGAAPERVRRPLDEVIAPPA